MVRGNNNEMFHGFKRIFIRLILDPAGIHSTARMIMLVIGPNRRASVNMTLAGTVHSCTEQ